MRWFRKTGALGETRTPMDFSTRTSSVRVCHFATSAGRPRISPEENLSLKFSAAGSSPCFRAPLPGNSLEEPGAGTGPFSHVVGHLMEIGFHRVGPKLAGHGPDFFFQGMAQADEGFRVTAAGEARFGRQPGEKVFERLDAGPFAPGIVQVIGASVEFFSSLK